MADFDKNNRSPRVEKLPDQRLRVTVLGDVLNHIPKTPAGIAAAGLWLAWGVTHETYTTCRLIKQDISGQEGPFRKPVEEPPQLVRVYEEIPVALEVEVGEPGISYDQYADKIVTIESIQFSTGTPVYGVPGTTAAPAPNTDAILKTEERTDDGTLQRITRVYSTGGLLADNEELKFGGKVKIRTVKYLNPAAPPTISGYTLVTTSTEFVRGLELVNYGFIAGGGGGGTGTGGIISTDTVYRQSSDQGTTGVTVTTITYLTDTTVVTNPISTPSGMVLISIDYEDDTGFRKWTGTYAKGTGEVAREITYGQTIDAGATAGTTTTTITYLTASTVSTNPTSAPAGSTLVKIDHRESDGYRVWSVSYGAGTGTVVTDVEIKNGAKLYLYHRVALNVAPTTPSATISGTVTLVSTDVRLADGYTIYDYNWAEGVGEISRDVRVTDGGSNSMDPAVDDNVGVNITTIRYLTPISQATPLPATFSVSVLIDADKTDQDGYRIWTTTWVNANAQGSVVDMDSTIAGTQGAYAITYHRIGLGYEPDAPAPTIGGSLTLIKNDIRQGNGYFIYDYTWVEGNGTIDATTRGREDGSIEHIIITLSSDAEQPANPILVLGTAAYCVSLKSEAQNGYFLNTAVYIEPPVDRNFPRTVHFTVPGLATAANPPVFDPPITRTLKATVYESFSQTQNTNSPYSVVRYSDMVEFYQRASDGLEVSNITSLDGYLGDSTAGGTNTTYRGIAVDVFSVAVSGSSPTAKPTGLTNLDTDCELYLASITGVKVWKNTTIQFTF